MSETYEKPLLVDVYLRDQKRIAELEAENAELAFARDKAGRDLLEARVRIGVLEQSESNEIAELRKDRARLVCLLKELHVAVWAESPQLLNEDSGGDAELDSNIRSFIE